MITGIINAVRDAIGLASEAVPDEDKRRALVAKINAISEETYRLELSTKTVPWVDALHKMGRQIMSMVTLGAGVYLLHNNPDIDPLALLSIVAPGGVYNYVKGKGR